MQVTWGKGIRAMVCVSGVDTAVEGDRFFFFFSFLFYTGVKPINNVVIVSGGQQRDAMVHIQASVLKVTG